MLYDEVRNAPGNCCLCGQVITEEDMPAPGVKFDVHQSCYLQEMADQRAGTEYDDYDQALYDAREEAALG